MARKQTLYISSTFEDLKAHRAALKASLEKAGFDVESMERYAAFPEPPLERCTADVAACDGYVLLLARRYGYEPERDGEPSKSITELEYEEARRRHKPVFVFCLDDAHPWNGAVDEGEAAARLARFRDRVQKDHGRVLFTDPDNLARQVLEALSSHRWPAAEPAAPAYRWPPAWDFSALVAQKREQFEGRDWLFDEIAAWTTAAQPRALLIRADFGVGKSALMAELAARNPEGRVLAAYFCQHDTQETLRPATFVRHLAARLAAEVPAYRAAVEAKPALQDLLERAPQDPATALEGAVLAPLAGLGAMPTRLVLIDALDEALELQADGSAGGTTLVSLLAAKAGRFPPWLRVVASSRPNPLVTTRLQAAFGTKEIDAEGAGNGEDLRRFVRGRCAREPLAGLLRDAGQAPRALEDLLVARSGGKFLYAARAIADLENGAIGLDTLQALPPGMDSFYLESFERRFARAGQDYAAASALLGVLAVAREPVAPALLAQLLGSTEAEVRGVHRLLPDFLRLRGGRLTFDHFSMAEWLTQVDDEGFARAVDYAVDAAAARQRWRSWALAQCEAGTAHQHDYLARHLADHLDGAAEQRRVLGRLMLGDVAWLQARMGQVGIDGLLADTRLLQGLPEQPLLLALLRSSGRVLREAPELLVAQVIGRTGALPGRPDDDVLPTLAAAARRHAENPANAEALSRVLLPMPRSLPLRLDLDFSAPDVADRLFVLKDGRIVAGNLYGDTLRIWDTNRPEQAAITLRGANGLSVLLELADGRIAVSGLDEVLRVWSVAEPDTPLLLRGHDRYARNLIQLADGRLVSGGGDETLCLWDLGPPVACSVIQGRYRSLALLADGRFAAISFDDLAVHVLDPQQPDARVVLPGLTPDAFVLHPLADGRLVAGGASSAWLFDPSAPEQPALALSTANRAPMNLVELPDGRLLVLESVDQDDFSVVVVDPRAPGDAVALEAHQGGVAAIGLLPGNRFVSVGNDRMVRIWDVQTLEPVLSIEGHAGSVTAVAVLADGRIASSSYDGELRIWDPTLAPLGIEHQLAPAGVRRLGVLPDGRLVGVGLPDGDGLQLWRRGDEAAPVRLALPHEMRASWRALLHAPPGHLALTVQGEPEGLVVWNLAAPHEAPGTGRPPFLQRADGPVAAAETLSEADAAAAVPLAFVELPIHEPTATVRLGHGRTGKATAAGTLVRLSEDRNPGAERRFVTDAPVSGLVALPDGTLAALCEDRSLLYLHCPP